MTGQRVRHRRRAISAVNHTIIEVCACRKYAVTGNLLFVVVGPVVVDVDFMVYVSLNQIICGFVNQLIFITARIE